MTATSTKPEALLWIDVETTGPDRTTAQILEIGMACTDVTATQDYGAFHSIVKPDILDINRITPWAWERHTANGLLAEKAKRKSLMDHILTIPLDGEDD